MYDLYFADEKSMPCKRHKRFRNFKKNQKPVNGDNFQVFAEPELGQKQLLPAVQLPEEICDELARNDITETARLFLRSPHSSLNSKGEAYIIAFDELLVMLWKPDSAMMYNRVQLERSEIIDLSGEAEDSADDMIIFRIITEEKTFNMWFPMSQADEVVEFINTWKVYIAHQEQEVESASEEDVHFVPDIREVAQADLPRTVLFGTLLIDQLADEDNNITDVDLEYLSMVISNTDLLSMCITNFKKHVTDEILQLVKSAFSEDQKLMLVSNMADLAYRDGEPHEHELLKIKDVVKSIDFPEADLEHLLKVFRIKNDPSTLEVY